ncbi:ester cyclase [Streptomyces spirodelae]|uniref:Ester cyclase n=1 Tax=Streptomyces spirodelae TaxID=2812904 RepID=A0ABS3X3X9_9ACTN|nr:ester cyclase [Streptomyces spirodelae]MBO8190082.1 ester cyclase [Streptomyces spirodelae]
MDEATLRALYERWLKELWNGDLSVAKEIAAPGFTIHHGAIQPGGDRELKGPEGITSLVSMSREYFDGLTFETEVGPVVQGDLICARWVGRGRYKGGFPGATAKPGTEVVFRGNDILRGADGRFVEYWVCSDGPYLAEQLGAG